MNLADMESVDEQLTAYLDGELPPLEATALERSLVDNERLRLRLAELRHAYDLLDEIPETPHDQRFTKSTMELVIKDLSTTAPFAEGSAAVVSAKPRDWWAWPRIMMLMGLFTVLGAMTAFAMSFVKAGLELRELGLIAGVRGLEDVHEVNIAVRLSQETELLDVLREDLGDRLVPPPPDSVWQRKAWVQSLTSTQVSRLESGRERMTKLDRETLTRLAAMETQIERLPEHEKIQETVHLLGLVLDGIGSSRRLDMEAMKSEQRYKFLREQLFLKAAAYYGSHMQPSDATALAQWDVKFFRPALIQELQTNRPMDTRDLLGLLLYRRYPQREIEIDGQEELIAELTSNLSKTGKKLIEGVNKADQVRVLNIWLFPPAATKSLLDGYDKLDLDSRDRLDLWDPQQVKRTIERTTGGATPRGPRRP